LVALVSEAAQNAANLNGDLDIDDMVVHVHPVGPGDWTNVEQAADALDITGDLVAFTTPEAAQGSSDLNHDGDATDRVLQVYVASEPPRLTNIGQAAQEFVLGAERLVAFRTSEAHQGGQSLNGDGDAED